MFQEFVWLDNKVPQEEDSSKYKAIEACLEEIPVWMNPKLEQHAANKCWACISIQLDGKEILRELDPIGLEDI